MYPFFVFILTGLYMFFAEGHILKKKKLDRDYKISRFIGGIYSIYAVGYLMYKTFWR